MYFFARYWWLVLLVLMFLWNFWGTATLLVLGIIVGKLVAAGVRRASRALAPPQRPVDNIVEWR